MKSTSDLVAQAAQTRKEVTELSNAQEEVRREKDLRRANSHVDAILEKIRTAAIEGNRSIQIIGESGLVVDILANAGYFVSKKPNDVEYTIKW